MKINKNINNLVITSILNIKKKKKKNISIFNENDSLINSHVLFNEILKVSHKNNKYKNRYKNEYFHNILLATLQFKNQSFRKEYRKWIYSNYSSTRTNLRRINQYENNILLNWAKQFNYKHNCIKILKIRPYVNSHNISAVCLMTCYSYTVNKLSFNFKYALISEYCNDILKAFNMFERSINLSFVNIIQLMLDNYIPDFPFKFIAKPLTSKKYFNIWDKFDELYNGNQYQKLINNNIKKQKINKQKESYISKYNYRSIVSSGSTKKRAVVTKTRIKTILKISSILKNDAHMSKTLTNKLLFKYPYDKRKLSDDYIKSLYLNILKTHRRLLKFYLLIPNTSYKQNFNHNNLNYIVKNTLNIINKNHRRIDIFSIIIIVSITLLILTFITLTIFIIETKL